MTEATATAALRVIGCNDEQTECDRCGKVELRGTVILADSDGVEVMRVGTTCAGYLTGDKVTRAGARTVEQYRRQRAVSDLKAARRAVTAGDLPAARMYLRDARALGLHRPDELRFAADLAADLPA